MTQVPVIMVTGMDDLASINQAYESGANDFVAKPINWPILGHRARYGHSTGDDLLQAVANRMKERLRAGDFVGRPALAESGLHFARLGGDEFTVVLPDVTDMQTVSLVAERLQALLGKSFLIENEEITVTSSIGVAIFPDDGDDAATLLKHADTAMYYAKEQGRNNWKLYDRTLTTQTMVRLALEGDLRKGLERNEFRLLYQPQVLADDGTIVGIEALLRWQHPEHGLMVPAQFVSVAEASGLIVPLGEWVLKTACGQLREWQQLGVHTPRLAINLSARQLRTPDFLDSVAAIIAESGLSGEQLEQEVIAEGVETRAQLEFLQRAKCPKLQGYLFSHPLPPKAMETLLRRGRITLPPTA